MQEVSRFADEEAQPFSPEDLAALSDLLSGETLHMGSARRVLEHMQKTGASPAEAVDALELSLLSDRAALDAVVRGIVRDNEALAQRYRSGKARAFQAIMGKIMQATKGRAHPAIAARLLEEVLREPDGPVKDAVFRRGRGTTAPGRSREEFRQSRPWPARTRTHAGRARWRRRCTGSDRAAP